VDRRGSLFGDLPEDSRQSDCGYRSAFQTFDPPDHAKGNVARAMLYMHIQHKLPLVGNLEMYKRWNQLDPPDDDEKARNGAIGRIQGNRNPYIDNPELIDRLGNMTNLNR
ncbi:MAG: endonuclease, partial [Alcanivoracaceae bacterium]|nr:endonuclease [Alcanivoracaceae bacterium]